MKTFKIQYKEVVVHEFLVDAESESDAERTFNLAAIQGEVDFSCGEIYESYIADISEVKR